MNDWFMFVVFATVVWMISIGALLFYCSTLGRGYRFIDWRNYSIIAQVVLIYRFFLWRSARLWICRRRRGLFSPLFRFIRTFQREKNE